MYLWSENALCIISTVLHLLARLLIFVSRPQNKAYSMFHLHLKETYILQALRELICKGQIACSII
jgi:hypothetical protein